jgi:hypothetical protein
MARPAERRNREQNVAASMSCRRVGYLGAITDSERQGLRPIGATAYETAARTGILLSQLLAIPGLWIFQGVLPEDTDIPRIPHVVSAGQRVLLVESVAWPPGSYRITKDGRIRCDGTYTGQSVRTLMAAVSYWRHSLPSDHRVSAVVVVHPTSHGRLELPAATAPDVLWTSGDNAVRVIRPYLPQVCQPVSIEVLTALTDATSTGP